MSALQKRVMELVENGNVNQCASRTPVVPSAMI